MELGGQIRGFIVSLPVSFQRSGLPPPLSLSLPPCYFVPFFRPSELTGNKIIRRRKIGGRPRKMAVEAIGRDKWELLEGFYWLNRRPRSALCLLVKFSLFGSASCSMPPFLCLSSRVFIFAPYCPFIFFLSFFLSSLPLSCAHSLALSVFHVFLVGVKGRWI